MWGVFVNTIAIVVGSILGLCLKKVITKKMEDVTMQILGICIALVGLKDALNPVNSISGTLVLILSFVIGGLIGTLLKIEENLDKFGNFCQKKFVKNGESSSLFSQGLIESSLMFCVGAMVIYGSISASLGDNKTLYIKAVMDGISALLLTVKFGYSVIFSCVPVFVIQGGIALLSGLFGEFLMQELLFKQQLSAIGGVFVLIIGLKLLGVKNLHLANYLPALLGSVFYLIS